MLPAEQITEDDEARSDDWPRLRSELCNAFALLVENCDLGIPVFATEAEAGVLPEDQELPRT